MSDLAWIAGQFAERRADHALPQGLYNDPRAFDFDMTAIYGHTSRAAEPWPGWHTIEPR